MSLQDWAGYDSLHDINHDEQEPYVLPIILRLEKDENLKPSHEEAQIATAHAIVKFFDSDEIIENGEWRPEVDKWLNGRIRKVARRARGAEWGAVKQLPHVFATYGKAEVIILPPHPNFAPPAEIKKLQISGMDLERKSSEYLESLKNVLVFSENPDISFTTGKSLAQVGHAVQLAIFNSSEEDMSSWVTAGMKIAIAPWDSFDGVEIHDAGFTEILAGSLTAKGLLSGR